MKVDNNFEASRGELRRQAQEWAGLEQNPKAELFVFVGRWSNQKGVDLIADVFPSILEEHSDVQLICIGPVIDLYGKFAALKLEKMMKLYPRRVFSKPEFTALPPYIFSGAEFALIPSRDEPFGLVAVEFGRKGALGVGARVGGLGQMPGWWFTVESMSPGHLLHQFRGAIESALSSSQPTRAMMRARSAKQRFPVAQWVEDLEILQSTAIRLHQKVKERAESHARPETPRNTAGLGLTIGRPLEASSRLSSYGNLNRLSTWGGSRPASAYQSRANSPTRDDQVPPLPNSSFQTYSRVSSYGNLNRINAWTSSRPTSLYASRPASPTHDADAPPLPTGGVKRSLSLGVKSGPGHLSERRRGRRGGKEDDGDEPRQAWAEKEHIGVAITEVDEDHWDDIYGADDEYILTAEEAERMQERDRQMETSAAPLPTLNRDFLPSNRRDGSETNLHRLNDSPQLNSGLSVPGTPGLSAPGDVLLAPMTPFMRNERPMSQQSLLSLNSVVGDKKDFKLQKVDPFFTDSTGEYYKAFEEKLQGLDGKSSESQFCIEEYLTKSEKKWFDRFRDARLGRTPGYSRQPSPAPSMFHRTRVPSPEGSIFNESPDADDGNKDTMDDDQFLLGRDYKPPTGLKKWMQIRVGDWPLYSLFLAFGQIIAANSYQITLLTGTVGQSAEKLYIIATIYAVTSVMWWFCFRSFKSIYVLSIPFLFYGLAVSYGHLGTSTNTNAQSVLFHRHGTLCPHHERPRMGAKRSHSILRHSLIQRLHLLCPQLRGRR